MTADAQAENTLGHTPVGDYGYIGIRVVVLPKRQDGSRPVDAPELLDLAEDELLPDAGPTPMSSYLESGKGGKKCCVFLVNGQRQDSLDNSFIVQELGFKYLRNRMMIIVDVDGLTPEALGTLMQGTRQEFFKGEVWNAILRQLVATLENDDDLDRLEQEAEDEVSELRAGDEKVKQTLDQLIDAHHEHGPHFAEGGGGQGDSASGENLGIQTVTRDGVVSLLRPNTGVPADYPVLVSQPASSIRLRPNVEREITVKSMPSNAWPALAELAVESDPAVPELKISQERLGSALRLRVCFQQPDGFDSEQYPIRAELRVTARFNGINEPRQSKLHMVVNPDLQRPPAKLNDPPTFLRVSSREPVRIEEGGADTHIRLRWDGEDNLASGSTPRWTFDARVVDGAGPQPAMTFSEPNGGRFSLLVAPRPEWNIGQKLTFAVTARGPGGATLDAKFEAVVVERPPEPKQKEPRRVEGDVRTGSMRRPPYLLKYIRRDEYESGSCWGQTNWTDDDPACFQDPTPRSPLTLIINQDLASLRDHRQSLTKRFLESEVERRMNKYTSHVAFHLYQMYLAEKHTAEARSDSQDERNSSEIRRVSATLIKLMEVSR